MLLPERVNMATAENGVVLRSLCNAIGTDVVANTLMLRLAETVDCISCTQPASSKWIRLFVQDWMARYPYETAEDFVLFLEGVRTSKFGPLFSGRIDGAVLFEKFEKYMAEKAQFRETRILREATDRRLAEAAAIDAAPIAQAEKEKLMQQIERLAKERRIAKMDKDAEPNPRREAHIAAGHKAAADANTYEDLVMAMGIYPYDEVQRALHERAVQLNIELPTREEFIRAARDRARNKR